MKNFVFIILTLGLVLLLVFFYQESFDKALVSYNKVQEVKKVQNDMKDNFIQMNSVLDEFKAMTELSNNLKNNKKELMLEEEDGKLIYFNENVGLKMYFDNKIFSKEKEKNFIFENDSDLIALFGGEYKGKELAISVLIDSDTEKCGEDNFLEMKSGDNVFLCDDSIATGEKYEYGITCSIAKNGLCFNFEYISFEGDLDDTIKVENILLNNLVFSN